MRTAYAAMPPTSRPRLDERYTGDTLDPGVWVPYYLPHWSSRAASEATWHVADGMLELSIPPDQDRWCPDLHEEPLRVSCIASASYAGPVGSTDGPQPFRDGLIVREAQPTRWGYTPRYARVETRMRAEVDEASMFAFWLSGIEDRPERSGEICVAEIFGSSIHGGRVDVGMGIHRFRDPDLVEAFTTIPMTLDPTAFHAYRADWTPEAVELFIDGTAVHRVSQSPDYPMQLMLGVFDFPTRHSRADPGFTPRLWVEHVSGSPLA